MVHFEVLILILESHPSVNETELQKLLVNVLRMNGDGKLQWTGADPPHWTYPRAIYFAVSVITTIGNRLVPIQVK